MVYVPTSEHALPPRSACLLACKKMNTTIAVLGALANQASNTASQTVLGGDGIVGLGVALICFFLSMLVTWAVLRLTLVVNGAAPRTAPGQKQAPPSKQGPAQVLLGEGFLTIRLEAVALAFYDAILAFVSGALAALSEALWSFLTNWALLIGLLIVAGIMLVWLAFHDAIIEVMIEIIQCDIRPTLDGTILPLINSFRVLFALVWPVVNALNDIGSALTWGNLLVIVKCTSVDLARTVVLRLLDGVTLLAQSFAYFITFGLLTNGRWDMIPGLEVIGEAINLTRAAADCYCLDVQPWWDFVYAIPTSPSLLLFIDCYTNSWWALAQIPINVIIHQQAPNTTNWAEEATCAVFSFGDWFEDIGLLFVEFLVAVVDAIEALVASLSVTERSLLFTRVAAMQAVGDTILHIPPSLAILQSTPGAVPMKALGMTWLAAANDAIRSAHGDKHRLFKFDMSRLERASADQEELNAFQRLNSASLFDPLTNTTIFTLGIDALLRVANTPWSRIFTGPVAVIIGAVNLTINAVSHPIVAFTTFEGMSYFQYGLMGDYTRMTFNAIVELLALFNVALPCTFSKPVQAIVSIPQSFVEFLTGAAFGWAYPPWAMGVPPPVNCSDYNCSHPAPSWWSPLDVFAQYYAWNGSRMRENLVLLEEGGECTAFLLGCNTTAENNNSTNITSNCTDAPLACTARGLNRVVVATINLTLAFVFYWPDIWRFNATYATFADLPTVELELALDDFNLCFGLFIDMFDLSGEHCLTSTPPDPRPDNVNITLTPDDSVGVYVVPPRTEWECRIENGAFYWDGREVIVLNSTDIFQLNETQYPCFINESRECAIAVSSNGTLEVLGSAPEDNVTLVVSPWWSQAAGAQALVLVYNATTGTSVQALPNASTLLAYYNVTGVVETDCTHGLPLPPLLGLEYGCSSTAVLDTYDTVFISTFSQFLQTYVAYIGSTIVSNVTALPCSYSLPTNIYCDTGFLYINVPDVGIRAIFFQNNTESALAFDTPLPCLGTSPAFPIHTVCRFNSLVVLREVPTNPPLLPNISLFFPVYYYPNAPASSDTQFLACENEPPPSYTCASIGGGNYAMETSGVLLTTASPNPTTFICDPNPMLTAPVCTQINISYSNGPDVSIELEGGEVRVFANDSKEAIPCVYADIDIPGINSTSVGHLVGMSTVTATALGVQDDERPIMEEGVNFRKKISYAQARALEKYLKRDADILKPVATPPELAYMSARAADIIHSMSVNEKGLAQIPRFMRLLVLAADENVTVYRKETFICCLSLATTATIQFFISFVFSLIYLFQGILTLPADPTYPVDIPTFSDARDLLRLALCKLACSITALLPFTLSCPGVGSDGTNGTACDDLTQCGRNFLCDLLDIPVLIADFIVNTLIMIKSLVNNTPLAGPSILGPSCSTNNPGDCVVSFLIFIVTDTTLTITMALRTGATVLDCLFCALARVVVDTNTCISGFYIVVGALCDIVDGLVATLLPPILNLFIGTLEFWIYLFGGQFAQMWNALSTKILASFFQLIGSIGNLIVSFLLKIPVINKIVSVILKVVQESCSILNTVIITFGGHNLGCNSITAGKKRGVQYTGWLAGVWSNTTYVWSHEAAAACGSRMITLNNTDYATVMDTPALSREVMYCMAAHLWVGPVATSAAQNTIANECDMIMPNMYLGGFTWASLDSMTQARALACVKPRLDAEAVRSDAGYAGSWFPHDFFSNMLRSSFELLDDSVLAYAIWNQYNTDRSVPAGQVVSSEYRASWASKGFSVAHLDTLASTVNTSAQAYSQLDAAEGPLSMQAYVERAVNGTPPELARALINRTYSAERIGGIIRSLIQPVMEGTGGPRDNETGEEMSFFSYVMQTAFDQIEERNDVVTTSVPLTASIVPRLFAASEPRLLTQTMSGMVDVFTLDIPAILVRFARTPARVLTNMKRALPTNAPPLPLYFYNVVVGAFTLAREFLTGKAADAHKWVTNPATKEWLASEAHRGHFKNPVGGAWVSQPPLISTIMSAAGALVRPLAHTSNQWARLLELAVSSDSVRSLRLSRMLARMGLLTASGGDVVVYQRAMATANIPRWARIAQVNNDTNIVCLFGVANDTLNTSAPNVTYPLCDTCIGLDQIFGRFQRAVYNVIYFFGGPSPSCPGCPTDLYPSLNYTVTNFHLTYDYLTNPAATVIVGYSPHGPLPVGYPSQNHTWLSWWDDPTPNKTGFSDLEALVNATLIYIHQVIDGVTFSASSVSVSGAAIGSAPVHASTLPPRDLMQRLIARSKYVKAQDLGPIHQPVHDLLEIFWKEGISWANATRAEMEAATITVGAGPFTTLQEVITAWVNYFLSFFLCPWQELSFNGKRFSLGYVLIYGIIVFFLLACVGQAIAPGNLLVVIFFSSGMAITIVLLTWIVVAYQYGYLCFPALPLGVGDDFMYFLVYSLLSKCGIWFSVVNEPYYSNSNCYPCANWRAGWFTVPNFHTSFAAGGRFGFSDIRYNIAFILRAHYPTIYYALRPGGAAFNIPGVGMLLGSPFFQTPLAAYAWFEPTQVTATQYRQYWQGATWVTGIPNLLVATAALYLFFKLFWPFIAQTLAFLFAVFLVVLPLILFFFTGVYMIASFDMDDPMVPSQQSHPSPPSSKDDEEEEQEQEDEEMQTLILPD